MRKRIASVATPAYSQSPTIEQFDALAARVEALEARKEITHVVLLRHAGTPVIGGPSGTVWAFPGNALTASTTRMEFDWMPPIESARWVIAWNPNTGASPTGVRLIHFDDGPNNITHITQITACCTVSPIGSANVTDVTAALQSLQAAGVMKNIGHQTIGNGGNGPMIYSSEIHIKWATLEQ